MQNGDKEVRPDIKLLINVMPLAFIKVKKPNNTDGILAERESINTRFRNPEFRRFVNITQFMVFSNNMEYDDDNPLPIEGAFYTSLSYEELMFNYFWEDADYAFEPKLNDEDEEIEDFILKDNNHSSIKHSPEFLTNKTRYPD